MLGRLAQRLHRCIALVDRIGEGARRIEHDTAIVAGECRPEGAGRAVEADGR